MTSTPSLVLELIDKAYAEKATFLDLGNCGLTAIPEEIVKLAPFLKELNLSEFYYEKEEVAETKNNNDNNDFSESEDSFSILSNLKITALYIFSTNINQKHVRHINQLKLLTVLDIGVNDLTDTEAKSIANNLSNLFFLDIAYNQLTDEGAIHIAKKLTKLTGINVAYNQLTQKGIEQLITLPLLTTLYVGGNNLEAIPESITDDINALRDYFQVNQLIPNTFVKVILMGNTTAGKSSLADYLINKKYKTKRNSTHGVQLWRWITDEKNPANSLTVNMWDFGGQDYYHATHTLFLSEKTMFLLLHTDKETHERDSRESNQYLSEGYWLGNAESLGGIGKGNLIWFVQSKYEPNNKPVTPSDSGMTSTNPRLFLEPSLATNIVSNQFALSVKQAHKRDPDSIRSFDYFRESLIAELRKIATQQLPKSWIEVRDKHLPEWRKTNLQLSVTDFWERCKMAFANTPSLYRDFDTFPKGLLVYLSGCGEIVWFQNNPILSDRVYLSVETLTKKLFEILSLKIKDNQGVFTLSGQADADRKTVKEYLNLLAEFKLIFKAAGKQDTFIIPQYLPDNPYTTQFQQLIQVAYVIRFTHYMPRSLVTRFLVTYGNTEGSYYWRYGAFFRKGNFHLFVQMDVYQQTVTIHISDGPTREKYTLLQELFRFFTLPDLPEATSSRKTSALPDDIRRGGGIPLAAKYKSSIYLSADGVEFATILDLETAIQSKITKVKSLAGNYISIGPIMHQLLNQGAATPKKIFLSYAHKDEQYKKELDTHFAALKRSGLVETWQDREIMAGEDWDKVIKEAIRQSDIVLLMLSPDFMASDYIWNTELPAAKAHNTEIVPLFIRPCDFTETQFELYKSQGLPGYEGPKNDNESARTRWIVSSEFPSRDEGYLKIVEGIRKKIKPQ
jgi:hypothetical protein